VEQPFRVLIILPPFHKFCCDNSAGSDGDVLWRQRREQLERLHQSGGQGGKVCGFTDTSRCPLRSVLATMEPAGVVPLPWRHRRGVLDRRDGDVFDTVTLLGALRLETRYRQTPTSYSFVGCMVRG
jgi:hypothetical protein